MAHRSPELDSLEPSTKVSAPSMICSVCLAKRSGNHIGIEACRACAVFYRRALSNKTFLYCRTGKEECVLDRDNVWACKKCRFNRIQQIVSQSLAHNHVETNKCTSSTEELTDSPSLYLDELGPMNVGPILQRFRRCYNDLCRRRLILEFGNLDNLPMNDHGFIEAPAEFKYVDTQSTKKLHCEVFKFLIQASDDFAVMKYDYQATLFANFMKIWQTFDGCYRSAKFYPRQFMRSFISYGRYLDIDRMALFFTDMPEMENKDEALRIIQEQATSSSAVWRPVMTRLKLTQEEYIGSIAYLLWNISAKSVCEDLVEVAERNKKAVLHELHEYYRSIGTTDYSARLGEIFMALSTVETLVNASSYLLDVFKLLDVLDEEAYLLAKLRID